MLVSPFEGLIPLIPSRAEDLKELVRPWWQPLPAAATCWCTASTQPAQRLPELQESRARKWLVHWFCGMASRSSPPLYFEGRAHPSMAPLSRPHQVGQLLQSVQLAPPGRGLICQVEHGTTTDGTSRFHGNGASTQCIALTSSWVCAAGVWQVPQLRHVWRLTERSLALRCQVIALSQPQILFPSWIV